MLRILITLLALAAGLARAEDGVQLNFTNADVEGVVKSLSDYTGRTFVIDPRVKGTINIVSSKPVPRGAVYPALLSALRMAGFAAVETGGITKILPEIEARTYAVPGAGAASGTILVTRVFTLQNASATLVLPVLRPMIAANNPVVLYAPGNAIIVTDYADNLRKIEQLINLLDRAETAPATEPVMVVLKYAMASDVAQLVRNVLTEPASVTPVESRDRVAITADSRLNAIVLRSDNAVRLARAQSLVAQLDQAPSASNPTGNVHIVKLRHANAAELAQTLRKVLGAESSSGAPTPAASSSPLASALATLPSAQSAIASQVSAALPTSSAPSAPAQTAFTANGATIFADAANNTLILNAPDAIARNLRAVIEQLDVRRAQVYVEALIIELSAERAAEFGVQWQALSGINSGDFRFLGGTNVVSSAAVGATANNALGLVSTIGQSNTGSKGLSFGAAREITIPGIGTVLSLAALAKALEKDAKANVLSVPTLLTLDNEEAKFSAGQNVPFITGQYALSGSSTTPTPFQTIERKDVGLTLRVKPQITDGGTVRMSIYQEVSTIADVTSTAGVITNKRFLETTALVEDGQVVALGGLMQDSMSDGEDRVPGLGSMPFIGNLFKYDTRKRSKTSLMVFLRPTILRTATQAGELGQGRYDQMRNEQGGYNPAPAWYWSEEVGPQLPSGWPNTPPSSPPPATK
jgi:general secretion pathway protein D